MGFASTLPGQVDISTHFRAFGVDRVDSAGTLGRPFELGQATTHLTAARMILNEKSGDPAFVIVVAPNVILHRGFADEIVSAIGDPGLAGIAWACLFSDGTDIDGRPCDAGNYLDDPATPMHSPLRAAAAADPAIAAYDAAFLRELLEPGEMIGDATAVIAAAQAAGRLSYLTSRLRFSAKDPRPPPAPSQTATGVGALLRANRPDPLITVAVRTTGRRAELLHRNLAALAHQASPALAEILVVSADLSKDELAALVHGASEDFDLPISVVGTPRADAASRTAALTGAIEQARGDYVWFVDDDDWAAPRAIDVIAGSVHANDRPIVIGAVAAVAESEGDPGGGDSSLIRTYLPSEWFRAFTGWNHLPNCAIAMPTDVARRRLRDVPLASDLGEDFALQLLLFTAPGSTVTTVDPTIAYVSVRGDDNSVTMADRTPWLRELGSHISDLATDPEASTAALWTLGRAVRDIPYPDSTSQPVEDPEDADSHIPTRPRSDRGLRRWRRDRTK